MNHRSPTLARSSARMLTLGLLVVVGGGCSSDPVPPPVVHELPDADRSSVEASKTASIRANGRESVDIKVTVRNAEGAPMAGRTVTIAVSGESVVVTQPAGPTDPQGVATAKVASTAAGIKTVTASVDAEGGAVALTSRPTLEFVLLPATRLAFTLSPSNGTAGAELGAFEVVIQDGDGETVKAATNAVTVALGSGPAEASLKGTVSQAAVNGVARFSALVLERASQGYTLVASATGLSSATSPSFDVAPAAPAALVMEQVPASVVAGTAISPVVFAKDRFENVVTDYAGTVRFTSNDGWASLPGEYPFTPADEGRHAFANGVVLKQAGPRRLTVTDTDAAALVAHSDVEVTAGPASALAFTAQPGSHSVRSPFAVAVALHDAVGNAVVADGPAVTLRLNRSGTLEGLASVAPVNGIASFSGLSIAQEDVGYVLTASADGLASATSDAFTITDDVAPASPVLAELAVTASSFTVEWKAVGDDGHLGMASSYDLRYSASPIASDADFAMAVPVKQVSTAIPAGTADSAKVSGLSPNTTYHAALEVKDDAGNAVRVTRPFTTPFPTPSRLAFLDQPSTGTAGSPQPALRVAIQDADGLLASNATSVVTLTPKGVSGFGPFHATADRGIATFSDVRIDKAGKSYTLEAASGSLTSATSTLFDVQHAAASRLALSAQAPSVTSGAETRATVTVLDAFGNTAESFAGSVALASSDSAASLPGAHTFVASDKGGYAFEHVVLNTAGVQTLTASATGLTPATVNVEVLLGALRLTGLPASITAGAPSTVTVEALDGFGARDTGYTGTVRFTSTDAAATLPAQYTFTAADAGRHAFTDGVVLKTVGLRGVTVTDTARATLMATAQVNVSAASAAALAFTRQPGDHSVRAAFSAEVSVQDAFGNRVAGNGPAVTLAVNKAAALSGVLTVTAVDGVAAFPGLSIAQEDVGYVLTASADSVAPASSDAFTIADDVAPAVPVLVALASTSNSITLGWQAVGDDGLLGRAASYELRYSTLPIITDADFAAATPVGVSSPLPAGTAESARISGLSPGTTYFFSLQVRDNAGNGVRAATLMESTPLPAPSRLAFLDQPSTGTAGSPQPPLRVAILNADGLVVANATSPVTLTVKGVSGIGPFHATADRGIATFSDVRIDKAGKGYTLEAASGSLTSATSNLFDVQHAAVARLALSAESPFVLAGAATRATTTALDAYGNAVEDYTGIVALSTSDSFATLPLAHTFTAADKGRYTFDNVVLRTAGRQTLTVTNGLALNDTVEMEVAPGAAAQLILALPSGPLGAGNAVEMEVTAKDAYGNVATGYAGTVRFTSSDVQATLPADASFTTPERGRKRIQATLRTAGEQTVSGQDVVNPVLFAQAAASVLAGPAQRLAFLAQPANGSVRVAMAPVTVALFDLYANRVSASAPEITVSLADGNPAATLGGTRTVAPVGGLATFATLTVDQQGSGYRLDATAGTLEGASSAPFGIVDAVAPSAAQLSIVRQTSTQVELRWAAVGDDGLLGPATGYDLRFATSPIDEMTFASAAPVAIGAPKSPGSPETAVFTGLLPSTRYYFALKVRDDAGNASAVSTINTTTTPDPCEGYTCTAAAPTCAADGVSRVTYTAACVEASDGAATCQQSPTTTACVGAGAVCFNGACETAAKPTAGSLRISEVMHSPSGSTTEYIELTNATGDLIDLSGLVVSYALGSGTPSGSFTVGPASVPLLVDRKGTFVLARDRVLATNGGVSADYAYGSALSMEGSGRIQLAHGATVVESLTYTASFPQATGRSMNLSSLVAGTQANAQSWYWCDSSQPLPGGDFGTPNAPNSACGITVALPLDWCAIQYPKTFPSGDGSYPATVPAGSSSTIYGQFYEPGLTDRNTRGNDLYPHVFAELGYGTDATNPAGWTWVPASANAGYSSSFSNNDEVQAALTIPSAGTYQYGFRFRVRDAATGDYSAYVYCDRSGRVTPPAGSYGTVVVTP